MERLLADQARRRAAAAQRKASLADGPSLPASVPAALAGTSAGGLAGGRGSPAGATTLLGAKEREAVAKLGPLPPYLAPRPGDSLLERNGSHGQPAYGAPAAYGAYGAKAQAPRRK